MRMRQWWAVRHLWGDRWTPMRLLTLCGQPFAFWWFVVQGPYPDERTAQLACNFKNLGAAHDARVSR